MNIEIFPYEFYKHKYETFSGAYYNGYSKLRKTIQVIKVDNSNLKDSAVGREFIRNLYLQDHNFVNVALTKSRLRGEAKEQINYSTTSKKPDKEFNLHENVINNFENYLDFREKNISIFQQGSGKMAIMNNENVVSNKINNVSSTENDSRMLIIIVEEPEIHLTHTRMRAELNKMKKNGKNQMFITTHNNMIASGLGLKCIINVSKGDKILKYDTITQEDQNFFMKKDNEAILTFMLSKKVIMVEGPAEYILLPLMYKIFKQKEMHEDEITLISAGNLSFKRYLNVAKINNNKVSVITDNDGSIDKVEKKYQDYLNESYIQITYPKEEEISTFEVSINTPRNKQVIVDVLNDIAPERKLDDLEWILKYKTKFALGLAEHIESKIINVNTVDENIDFEIPEYIIESFMWLNNDK